MIDSKAWLYSKEKLYRRDYPEAKSEFGWIGWLAPQICSYCETVVPSWENKYTHSRDKYTICRKCSPTPQCLADREEYWKIHREHTKKVAEKRKRFQAAHAMTRDRQMEKDLPILKELRNKIAADRNEIDSLLKKITNVRARRKGNKAALVLEIERYQSAHPLPKLPRDKGAKNA